ncbi:MAG: hypothetical protein A2046_09585, partial [Bacteroidetes bacterium GWA2_30_7]
TDTGALGFSQQQKGTMMGVVTAILYLLPILTGAIADKIGFKKVLIASLIMMSSGYLLISQFTSYAGFFISFLYLGIGASLFKPIIGATITKTTTKETSSIGFGIFYMLVNIGSFIGPIFSSKLREHGWHYVFWMSSAAIILNIILTVFFFKVPEQKKNTDSLTKSLNTIFLNIYTVLKDLKFAFFLLLITCFWAMYNQLFYTLPIFIDQWVNTEMIYSWLNNISPLLAENIGTAEKNIAPEMITNIDALYIILFQIIISAFVMRFRPVSAMTIGILTATIGLSLTFFSNNGFILLGFILVFAIGEMASSPKIIEYIGKIAPPDKTALYIGTSYLPMAGGNLLAGYLSGNVYSKMSDKISILKIEFASRGIAVPEINQNFTNNDLIKKAYDVLNMNKLQLNTYLWDKYNPSYIWVVIASIGLFSVIGLLFYDFVLLKKKY